MSAPFLNIPRMKADRFVPLIFGRNRIKSPVPPADRTLLDGSPAWFCLPNWGYCGATARGIRCSYGAQLAGHDFGDEDPRQP